MEETNSKSIASLALGILSIFIPFVGLILGIIGIILSSKSMKEIDQTSEKGKGLAISGKICSIVGICVQILLVLLIVLSIASFSFFTNSGSN
ncbi:DUF4190 domain-containing protein [Viridibacillus sp. FSL R5-0477]|uniref:DUF4190 domain-containing protein n=1 Tax=Viridibacillus arenosi FSL R5-213 TaxID=1227360 RepID=W4F3A6_9BACL|nr:MULTISPECIES: DUF4190 domain-containing protein [Viridibacillus]ETT86807.1 hypothetical protein C176_08842 [Viridibacillus arenosi FSL R5-213]OMC83233.1 hypothetical protein BK128_19160 [Viridibacillus sp. FSL H7-0596]OMC83391.1 hypothetical protein BK130_07575 [Viridibacillus sp. FSL H8-0123]OMC88246.1 hypothetical protein BK137_19495 [Viridibacillus arenosi]